MRGLSLLARSVYVFGLRPYMDYRTGLVGVVRGISYQSIAEELYVEPGPGVTDSGSPTVRQLERAVVRLERAGLVARDASANERARKLVFCLPLAASDKSAPNKVVGKRWDQQVADPVEAEPSNGAASGEYPAGDSGGEKTAEVVPPPVSGNNNTGESARAKTPSSPNGWAYFFAKERRGKWAPGYLMGNSKLVALFIRWVRDGITAERMQLAMTVAEANLGGTPETPAYYDKFLTSLERAQAQQAERGAAVPAAHQGVADRDYAKGLEQNDDGTLRF